MPSFQIVQVMDDGSTQPVAGYPTYEDGKEAKFYANQLQMLNPGAKYQPRPIMGLKISVAAENDSIPFWPFERADVLRQKRFFINPVYDPKQMVVRYYESTDAIKTTAIELQSFLNKFFQVETEKTYWTNKIDPEWFDKNYTYGFARTEEEIVEIYKDGIHSCMSKEDDCYVQEKQPVRCYATEDFAIFYVRDRQTRRLKARAVVCPKRKIYSRPYGNTMALEFFMKRDGYKLGLGDDWLGLRFPTEYLSGEYYEGDPDDYDDRYSEYAEGYAAPYLDFWQLVTLSEDNKWFTTTHDGEWEACCTHGLADKQDKDEQYTCDECEKEVNSWFSYDEHSLCYECAKKRYGLVGHTRMPPDGYELSTNRHPKTHTVDGYLALGSSYHYKTCTETGEVYIKDSLPSIFNEHLTPAEAKKKYNEHFAILEDAFVSPSSTVADRGTFYPEVPAAA